MNLREYNKIQRKIINTYRLLSLLTSDEGREEYNKICEYLSYFKKYELSPAISNCMEVVVLEELEYFSNKLKITIDN